MKIKRVGAICNAGGAYYLMGQKNPAGKIVHQWLGDGKSAYPLVGLPYMKLDNICAMFDITEKKRDKLILRQLDAPESMNWEDTDITERQIEEPKLCVRYDGRDLLPLETSVGITFIQEKYLAPLDGLEYMRLYERREEKEGLLYIVAKIGLMIQAVIMPMDLPDNDFMNLLESLTRQCRAALLKREFAKSPDLSAGKLGPLFRVDESTGEVIEEGAEE